MGCTWFSVVCLALLIMASFLENMKANTQPSEHRTTNKHSDTSMDTSSESPNTSSASDEQQTNDDGVTMKTDENCSFTFVDQQQNNEAEQNSSETKRCTYFVTSPVPFEGNSSSNESEHENVVLKRTYRDFPEYQYYKNVEAISPYITTIPGLITNPLTIFIAMRIKPRYTCELYMIVLACADLLTVSGKLVYRMVDKFVDTRYSWECKLILYIFTIGQVYSNLILMSWTLERFIAVMFPLKLGVWCSIRNTKITLSLLFLFCLALSVPNLTEFEAITFWNGQTFVNICSFSEFIYVLWIHVESVYYIYIPVTVVAICNVMILFRLKSMMKARISMASNKETIDKKTQENQRMTILLLSISATFFLLHIPYIIATVIGYLYPDVTVLLLEDPHFFIKILCYSSICYILSEFQNCINFFLYCLSGSKFRTTLLKLVCRCVTAKEINAAPSSRTDTTKI